MLQNLRLTLLVCLHFWLHLVSSYYKYVRLLLFENSFYFGIYFFKCCCLIIASGTFVIEPWGMLEASPPLKRKAIIIITDWFGIDVEIETSLEKIRNKLKKSKISQYDKVLISQISGVRMN